MRELTACGSCEFVWLDSFDSFIVAAVVAVNADADANADVAGNGAAAAHVWPKYKKAILATLAATLATCCCFPSCSPFSPLVCSASAPSSSALTLCGA